MALVVAARSPARLEASHWLSLRAVAVLTTFTCVAALVVDSAARALPFTPTLDAANVLSTALAGALTFGVCIGVWLTRRTDGRLLLATTLAVVLAALRAVGGPLLVAMDLSTIADVVNVGLGLLVLGALVWGVTTWTGADTTPKLAQRQLFAHVVGVTALVLFAVGVSGATVSAVGASWACQGVFPDCNGLGALPFGRDPQADIQLYHRLLAYVAAGLVLWLTIEAFRTQRAVVGVRGATLVLLGATLLDGAIGALSVSLDVPAITVVGHTAATALTWSSVIVLLALARSGATLALAPAAAANRGHVLTLLGAYVQLTKPRVMSLLLATTAAAMVIAARGLPDLGLVVATLVGGALMSGGAGAINHYVDRDIDPLMGRTAWRPIPSGVIKPRHALWFGIVLGLIASAVFAVFVNPVAMVLAQIGLLGYVFIYTLWLKRSTPSNIVIGGAAGAIPPLVGWAAVTHEIGSLTAWYLFAIIFFWTPPHFWALSLLIRQHYERAGVPMLPVVRGEDETRRQIILYSILLVALTLVLSPFGMMGPIYFAAAVLLGGLFILDAVRLLREGTRQAARRLYLYSILYLFALFAAMAIDRVVVR
jgi:protoheme IX farnesyltransferase